MPALFGPAGNSDSFSAQGYKSTLDAPKYVSNLGLDAYEYQCGRGVKISEEMSRKMKQRAIENEIKLSIHAPYYISLSSVDEKTRMNSISYIIQTAQCADFMGADRIVIHSGSCAKISRNEACELAIDTLKKAKLKADELGLGHIHFCPETMGKINQLGTLLEVMELCKADESFIPCIDFGHINARTNGSLMLDGGYQKLYDDIVNTLGYDRAKIFHAHFSKIEYTEKGGEVRHLTFADEMYGPNFEPLMELVYKYNLLPTLICESAGTQAEDALAMKKYYNDIKDGVD